MWPSCVRASPKREQTHLRRGEGGVHFGFKVDYAFERAGSETKSIHHYLYSILETTLDETAKLVRLDDGYDIRDWNQEKIPDGTLVLARGKIRLADIERTVDALNALPRIMETITRFQKRSLKKTLDEGTVTRGEYESQLRKLNQEVPNVKEMSDIAEIVRRIYGDTIRVRVYPFESNEGYYLSGALITEYLQHERSSLFAAGAMIPASKWYAMGIVNQVEPSNLNPPSVGEGASLEDILVSLLSGFSKMAEMTLSVTWPVMAMTPLAVYREV